MFFFQTQAPSFDKKQKFWRSKPWPSPWNWHPTGGLRTGLPGLSSKPVFLKLQALMQASAECSRVGRGCTRGLHQRVAPEHSRHSFVPGLALVRQSAGRTWAPPFKTPAALGCRHGPLPGQARDAAPAQCGRCALFGQRGGKSPRWRIGCPTVAVPKCVPMRLESRRGGDVLCAQRPLQMCADGIGWSADWPKHYRINSCQRLWGKRQGSI